MFRIHGPSTVKKYLFRLQQWHNYSDSWSKDSGCTDRIVRPYDSFTNFTILTKAKLIEEIARRTGLTKLETKAAIIGFWDTIEETLAEGESIELRGYGSFRMKHQPARQVRNPATGQLMQVKAKDIPVFKPSKEFKDRIKAGNQ